DVTTVMRGKGVALMGIGSAKGPDAASKAMRAALDYKLLEEDSINGAKGAIINVTGSEDMPLGEVEDAIRIVEEEADDNADIIWGTVFKPGMEDEIKVTVIATGFDSKMQMTMPHPQESSATASSGMAPVYMPSDAKKSEDMNVPTFIRRQAD
ncbi:MAG: cell division protein FtsZ, partial [Acidobacteriota bacterium]|nr:cell division protein FtsZ [Acidobacteriota bacterium]